MEPAAEIAALVEVQGELGAGRNQWAVGRRGSGVALCAPPRFLEILGRDPQERNALFLRGTDLGGVARTARLPYPRIASRHFVPQGGGGDGRAAFADDRAVIDQRLRVERNGLTPGDRAPVGHTAARRDRNAAARADFTMVVDIAGRGRSRRQRAGLQGSGLKRDVARADAAPLPPNDDIRRAQFSLTHRVDLAIAAYLRLAGDHRVAQRTHLATKVHRARGCQGQVFTKRPYASAHAHPYTLFGRIEADAIGIHAAQCSAVDGIPWCLRASGEIFITSPFA